MNDWSTLDVLKFATEAHTGQKRKYTGDDYIVHPMAVAELVRKHGGSKVQVAAALLHDTVEDTSVTNADVKELFGGEVANLVHWLTDTSRPSDGNRAIRKGIDADRLASAPAEAQFVKVADLVDNTTTIVVHDKSFAKVYLKEKNHLLKIMTKVHGSSLWRDAMAQMKEMAKSFPLDEKSKT